MLNDIVFAFTVFTMVIAMWIMLFFIFDSEILKGYFKKKLQKRFDVESL
jgi:hypothetical protein